MSQDHLEAPGGLILLRKERASPLRLDAERVEVAGIDSHPVQQFRLAVLHDGSRGVTIERQALERAAAISQIVGGCEVDGFGERAVAVAFRHLDQTVGMGVGKRLQEHTSNHREDGCVASNAKGEGNHGSGGERRALAQDAKRVSQVLPDGFDKAGGVHSIDLLPDLSGVPEFSESCGARFEPRHATRNVVVGFGLDVELEVARDLAIEVFPLNETAPIDHIYSVAGRSTRLMPVARRCHLDVSAASCLRPAGVSR